MDESPNPWLSGGIPLLSLGATHAGTRALGPGLRYVVWVQGCCFSCPGCISPEWIPRQGGCLVDPMKLAEQIAHMPDIDGVTLSGGEPMLQAAGLARMLEALRRMRDLTALCFTGFTLERLLANPPGPGVADLLQFLDVLIDGPYLASEDDNQGLRGSRNQRIHYLTQRLAQYDLANQPRRAEVNIEEGVVRLVGVPPKGAVQALNEAVSVYESRKHDLAREDSQ